jgi:hypothetical protein
MGGRRDLQINVALVEKNDTTDQLLIKEESLLFHKDVTANFKTLRTNYLYNWQLQFSCNKGPKFTKRKWSLHSLHILQLLQSKLPNSRMKTKSKLLFWNTFSTNMFTNKKSLEMSANSNNSGIFPVIASKF